MQFPEGWATEVTDAIMTAIKPHVIRDPSPQENHHYNRAYEKVHAILSTYDKLKGGKS